MGQRPRRRTDAAVINAWCVYPALVPNRHLWTLDVRGRPATFATAGEASWKDAVRLAIEEAGCEPLDARFSVRMVFRLGVSRHAGEVWDLDNLIKPTLDAMEGIFGRRQWRGRPQPADDRVDQIKAEKRPTTTSEVPGATIDVWAIE